MLIEDDGFVLLVTQARFGKFHFQSLIFRTAMDLDSSCMLQKQTYPLIFSFDAITLGCYNYAYTWYLLLIR